MTRRMLDGGIWANEHFADLPPMARLLLIGIINLADDQGRMKAHPAYLRSQVFPYDDVALDDVREWLARVAANETILLYEANGKQYLQLLNWWQYQSPAFASPSEHPRPAGWTDRVRYTGKNRIIYTFGWVSAGGEELPDTCDQDGNPLPGSGVAHGQASGRAASQSPGQPGGRSHGQPYAEPRAEPGDEPGAEPHGQPGDEPGRPLNEYENKNKNENKKEGEGERAQPIVAPTATVPPLPPPVLLFAEFLPRGSPSQTHAAAIAATVTDLDRWRAVLTEWSLRGFNAGNVRGLLDWYRDGIPPANGAAGKSKGAQHAKHGSGAGEDVSPSDGDGRAGDGTDGADAAFHADMARRIREARARAGPTAGGVSVPAVQGHGLAARGE